MTQMVMPGRVVWGGWMHGKITKKKEKTTETKKRTNFGKRSGGQKVRGHPLFLTS
jgi:hypothetical protein